ncbi:coiled-coil domain-containing protein 14 isoform X2 [Cottoperca gobio]|uniref:Coiled-coil domain-containing protein 14 isoform X2 n=1 Tax=Cottoperca gobio TaxID=56716 RepID=A0A6J2R632_COTGO|nr:coiled-coil domain-containing protein 14 isoform X2 [Cottoperca gobio]
MKGTAQVKVVTSGRLTGGVKVQLSRRRGTHPGPAACTEPAYSLYSTDSEEQVTSLHQGLDRCAALLGGILQAEKAAPPRAVKGGAAKSRPSTSLRKKPINNTVRQRLWDKGSTAEHLTVQRGAGRTPARTTRQSAAAAALSPQKLHPLQTQPPNLLQHLRPTTPPPQPSISPSGQLLLPQTECQAAAEVPHAHCVSECDGEEDEFVPVRDINTQSSVVHTAVRHTHSHVHTCTLKMSSMQLEPGQSAEVPQDTQSEEDGSAETQEKVKTVQCLLGELKALIAGRGSVAERLLCQLEQTVSSPRTDVGGPNITTAPDPPSLHSHNSQLRRRVRILNQQLKEREKAERQQSMETLGNSEVLNLQEELHSAQSRLQELQDELTEVREALQDTQSQLTDREAENTLIRADLEATRSRLLDSERQKSDLASLALQRLEEIGNCNRILQSQDSSNCPPAVDTLTTKPHVDPEHRQDPGEPPTDRITQFLMSLGQLEPTHIEHVCVSTERQGDVREQKNPRDASSHPDVRSQRSDKPARRQNACPDQSHSLDDAQSCGRRLSQCDVESVCSDWSTRSGSTFDTRDEAAFRDGLAALDASIASLQKTIQLDLGR